MSWWSILVICISRAAHSKSPMSCVLEATLAHPQVPGGSLVFTFAAVSEREYSSPILWRRWSCSRAHSLKEWKLCSCARSCHQLCRGWMVWVRWWHCHPGVCCCPEEPGLLWEMVTNTLLPPWCGDLPCDADLLSWLYFRCAAPVGSCCGSWSKNPSAAGGFWRSSLTADVLGMWQNNGELNFCLSRPSYCWYFPLVSRVCCYLQDQIKSENSRSSI